MEKQMVPDHELSTFLAFMRPDAWLNGTIKGEMPLALRLAMDLKAARAVQCQTCPMS